MTELPTVRENDRQQPPAIVADHSSSMLYAAVCLLREKPPHLASLIVIMAICGMVLAVVAHGEAATIVIGVIAVAALVVAGFRVK